MGACALRESAASDAPGQSDRTERGRLFAWTIYAARSTRAGLRIDERPRHGDAGIRVPRRGRAPAVTRSRELPVVREFLESDDAVVRWSATDPLAPSSGPTSDTVRAAGCDLSFGGAFDTHTSPLYQLIRIGGFNLPRALPAGRP